ncbi:sigma-70 family RNA polymerase sigma factor [Microbacterium sp. NPDC019599]|uniref:RNA polymerase sigma factor n=1 Tax=Microbacterium sp. NPDC019599 TaxID=3154690 RepID=UPI0034018FCB
MEQSDQALWGDVVAGDARAFGIIWDRHHVRVFRHLVAGGASTVDAEDLSAAAFLELWRKRRSIRFVDGSVLPWLIVTARNVERNASRAKRRYHRFLAALPAPALAPDPADTDHDLDDRTAQIRVALASVKQLDSDLLAMTAIEGLTVREAAAAVGLSESAAKMRLSRLPNQLRSAVAAPIIEGGTS